MRELYIDWIGLLSAFQMNVPEVRCFLSLEDGKVLKVAPGDAILANIRAALDRYIPIDTAPSRIQYQWLYDFVKTITDETLKARIEAAINGKGAFRRFKDILMTMPDERRSWFEFRDRMMRKRIVEWVREQGIVPLNEVPWPVEEMTPVEASPSRSDFGSTPSAPSKPVAGTVALNSTYDVEALRDFLIEWNDKHGSTRPTPLELEELATQIAKNFRVKSLTFIGG